MSGDQRAPSLLALYEEKRLSLVRLYTARLRSRAEAEDLVQELYFKVAAVEGDAALTGGGAALLHRMAENLMLDRLRSAQRGQARDEHWRRLQGGEAAVDGDQAADAPSAEAIVEGRQRLGVVLRALEGLSPPVARAFRLHKLDGLSHSETAAAMGVSRSSVEKYVSAALKAVVRSLHEQS
ncbi:MAG: RNA polymerase sigma factor [Caulobacter sp.]